MGRVTPKAKIAVNPERPSQRPSVNRDPRPIQAFTVTLHITEFEGGNALSEFRVQQLLPRLQAIHESVSGIAARFVHLVAADHAPSAAEIERLAALLTYGEPYREPHRAGADGPLIVATPRFGTVSPWASKATDIAHNCGIALKRIERITEFRVGLKSGLLGRPALTAGQLQAIAGLRDEEARYRATMAGLLAD